MKFMDHLRLVALKKVENIFLILHIRLQKPHLICLQELGIKLLIYQLLPLICSNNFGPYQHKEKLIPKIIKNLLKNKKIPLYGNGKNMRDWIYVKDHVKILYLVYLKGTIGETYNIGVNCVLSNLEIVKKLVKIHNKYQNEKKIRFKNSIKFVEDRKGHDFRYALDSNKIKNLEF